MSKLFVKRRCIVLIVLALVKICMCLKTNGLTDSDCKNRLDDHSPGNVVSDGFVNVATSPSNSTQKRSSSFAGKRRAARGPTGCGMNLRTTTRIIGGTRANRKDWPWMVAILKNKAMHCGGVLMTDRHVLTAAHCFLDDVSIREITVRLAEYDFSDRRGSHRVDFRAVNVRKHENFDPVTYNNDIAILKFDPPTTWNDYIWPICLPPDELTYEREMAWVTGWGTQGWTEKKSSKILRAVQIPVWTQDDCRRAYPIYFSEMHMCAGGVNGGRDACQGDSGGPLVHQLSNGKWVNIGIVSWGIRCGERGHPGIYTRVGYYLDWIFQNTDF